ncbi:hypothetical protein LA080_008297 [Diaporthe eres]|uniref:Uncharacterized protein n=1 Tax=Diaporthe vaccinii TaxID=105482 RepID=A0ABR4EA40_9PEZI|nr:hypothetical protein LA080_008297 [Diaporthe eres]
MAPLLDKTTYEPVKDSEEFEGENRARFAQPSYEKPYRRVRIINVFLIFALVLTATYAAYVRLHPRNNAPLLGTDPFGFIPPEIGEPKQWMYFDESDPYFIPYDIFNDVERVEAIVEKLIELDHPGILTHGQSTSYMGFDKKVHGLPQQPAYRENLTEEFPVYFTRAFHQMHCIILITDSYGHLVHGLESRWDSEHIAHCVNVLREAVSCFADASVASFTSPKDHHIAMDQRSYCRNYMALREWADDPAHAARYDIVENLLPQELKKHSS